MPKTALLCSETELKIGARKICALCYHQVIEDFIILTAAVSYAFSQLSLLTRWSSDTYRVWTLTAVDLERRVAFRTRIAHLHEPHDSALFTKGDVVSCAGGKTFRGRVRD